MCLRQGESKLEDIKLVEEILDGNIDSFNILVNKYEFIVLKFVYNMLKDKEAAEDITQEVFITIYNKLEMYNMKNKFSSWLLQIAKNKCIDYIRKYRKVYESNIDEARNVQSNELVPEEALEYNETKREVQNFINNLEETDRQILILKYSEDVTFNDIADILQMNVSAVKRRYYKARDEFKKYRSNLKRGVGYEV